MYTTGVRERGGRAGTEREIAREKQTGHEKRQEATAHHIQERSIEANDNKRSITYEKKPAAREKGPLSLLDRRRGRARTHARLPSRSDISVWWTVGQLVVVLRQESVARESLRIVRGMFQEHWFIGGKDRVARGSVSGSSVSVCWYVKVKAVEERSEGKEKDGRRRQEEERDSDKVRKRPAGNGAAVRQRYESRCVHLYLQV